MCVCVCVCVCVGMCMYVNVCLYVCMSVCLFPCKVVFTEDQAGDEDCRQGAQLINIYMIPILTAIANEQ